MLTTCIPEDTLKKGYRKNTGTGPISGGLKMKKENTTLWNPVEHFDTEEDIAAYLEAALEENDTALIAAALGDIARAIGMSKIAEDTGLGRESLYKALLPSGNPELSTVLKIIEALGLHLQAVPKKIKNAG